MIRLNKDASGTAEWPSVAAGEAHAIVLRSKQQALELIAYVATQAQSVVISPWHENDDLSTVDTKVVVWKYLKRYRKKAFFIALQRIALAESTIIYIVDAATSTEKEMQPVLDNTLCDYAKTSGKAVIVILLDLDEHIARQALVSPMSQFTSFHTIEGKELDTWRVHFWFKNGHVFRYVKHQSSAKSTSQTTTSKSFRLGDNAPKYVSAGALEYEETLPSNWRQIESHNNISDFIEAGLDGTIILAATKQDGIHQLLEQVYAIRLQAGNVWKIFVRERDRVIRMSEEKLLLAAGATMVLPQQLPFHRVLSLTESVTNWQFDRELPDICVLMARLDQLTLKGIVAAKTFFESVLAIARQHHHQSIEFTLVFAHLASGVNAKEVLSRAQVHRAGDMITYTRDGVYIFLPACRIADVDKVLFGMFQMPISHLFANEERATSLRSVELIAEKALRGEIAAPTAPMDLNIMSSADRESYDELHYFPQPAPAKLSSERN